MINICLTESLRFALNINNIDVKDYIPAYNGESAGLDLYNAGDKVTVLPQTVLPKNIKTLIGTGLKMQEIQPDGQDDARPRIRFGGRAVRVLKTGMRGLGCVVLVFDGRVFQFGRHDLAEPDNRAEQQGKQNRKEQADYWRCDKGFNTCHGLAIKLHGLETEHTGNTAKDSQR